MNKKIFFIIPFFLFLAAPAYAVNLEVALPGMPSSISNPAEYVRYLFIFGLSLAGLVAVVAIIIGGIQYMLAGSVGSVEKSKTTIFGALLGVGLIIGSYLLLATIDPTLTNLTPTGELKPIKIQAPAQQEQVKTDSSSQKASEVTGNKTSDSSGYGFTGEKQVAPTPVPNPTYYVCRTTFTSGTINYSGNYKTLAECQAACVNKFMSSSAKACEGRK